MQLANYLVIRAGRSGLQVTMVGLQWLSPVPFESCRQEEEEEESAMI